MAIEKREIEFSQEELREAISHAGLMAHTETIQEITFLQSSMGLVEISIRVEQASNVRTIQLAVVDVVTAVLDYCRKINIPLPRAGRKKLAVKNNRLILQVELSSTNMAKDLDNLPAIVDQTSSRVDVSG